jgi:hypothetical protein
VDLYSTFDMEREIVGFFLILQATVVEPMLNEYPEVNFLKQPAKYEFV